MSPALASDKCKNVTIKVENHGKKNIKTIKMHYKAKVDNKERSESLPNTEVKAGKKVTIDKRHLEHIKNDNVKWIKLDYKLWCGGKWSKTMSESDSKFDDSKCNEGKTYRIDITKSNDSDC